MPKETPNERRLRQDKNLSLTGLQNCDQNWCRREGTIQLPFIYGGVILCKKHAVEWLKEEHTMGRQLLKTSIWNPVPPTPKPKQYERIPGARLLDDWAR